MSQNRFDEARERLSSTLKRLEEIVIEKIHETSMNAKMLDVVESDESSLQSKVIEQTAIIQNLSGELNKIQKTFGEIGKENDFLKDKNNFFADKVFKFKTQGSSLIQAVESDLVRIREIIKNDR